jgi:hypothetical protein
VLNRHEKGVNRRTVLPQGFERDGFGNDSSYEKLQIVQEKSWQGWILSRYLLEPCSEIFAPIGSIKGSYYIAHFAVVRSGPRRTCKIPSVPILLKRVFYLSQFCFMRSTLAEDTDLFCTSGVSIQLFIPQQQRKDYVQSQCSVKECVLFYMGIANIPHQQ